MGLLTVNEQVGRDVSAIFNTLSGYSEPPKLHKITMAPTQMRDRFIYMIRREAEYASEGKKAKIICKMNSLCDFEVMQELYKASMAGVEIDLIVRGICCLIPGIKDVSENISIRSIVGKYLEHSRIYYFYNDGKENIYLSSADWMPRNLNRRVELLFPIEAEQIKARVMHMLAIQLKDVVKAKVKDKNKNYNRIDRRGKEIINSQNYLFRLCLMNLSKVDKYIK
jgi:polyphosphate kinase